MNTGFRHQKRQLRTIVGFVLSIAALLAFAGPASAHQHGSFDGSDGEPAGTISSFDPDSGVLTIDLAKGGSISALVTDDTWIETGGDCRGHDSQADDSRRGRHGGWHHGREGSSEDLVPGAVVDDAVLVLEDGSAVFAKVELDSPRSR